MHFIERMTFLQVLSILFCTLILHQLSHLQWASAEDNLDWSAHDAEHRLRNDLGLGDVPKDTIHVQPPHTGASPVVLYIGLSLILLRELDARNQILTSEGWLKLGWKDSRLKWASSKYNDLNVLRVPDHHIWQPDMRIYNAAKVSEIDAKKDVYTMVYSDGEVVWKPPVTMYTICEVDLRHFPYDKHTCPIKLGSWTFSADNLDLKLYDDKKGIDMYDLWNTGGEWDVVSSTAVREVTRYACCNATYPSINYELTIRRRSPLYKMTVLCPVLSDIGLLLISLWLPPYALERITVNCLGLLILVLELLHLSSEIPYTGANAPIIVLLCGNLTIVVTLTTIMSVFYMCMLNNRKNRPIPHWVQQVLSTRFASALCISSPGDFEPISNRTRDIEGSNLMEIESKHCSGHNQWVQLFQMVDRITFIVVTVVIIIVLILSST